MSAPGPRSAGERVFRWLLRLYPSDLRRQHEADFVEAFHRDRRRLQFTGATGALRFWRLTVSDVIRTAASARAGRFWPSRRGRPRLGTPLADLRQAVRALRRRPGFAIVAILTLGLGVGATTTIFAVVDRTMLTPLPYPDSNRLVRIYERQRDNPNARMVAYGNYADLRAADVLADLAIWAFQGDVLTGIDTPRVLRARQTSANFATTLGVLPLHGRWFDPEEERRGDRIVVLAHSLWVEAFGRRPDVVGQTAQLDGTPVTVVGIMPPGFDFPSGAELWRPLPPITDPVGQRRWHRHNMVGRLPDRAQLAAVQAAVDVVAEQLESQHPDLNAGDFFEVRPLLDDVIGTRGDALTALFAAVAVLLLVACVNVAALTLARAVERARELAVRSALGASRWRLASVAGAEAMVIASGGSLVGLLLAAAGVQALLTYGADLVPRAEEIGAFGVRVYAFAVLAALCASLATAIAPVLAMRARVAAAAGAVLHGGRVAVPRGLVRSRRWLVVAQLALAFALATTAGLFMKSVLHLRAVDTGVSADHVLSANIQLSAARYPDGEATSRFVDSLTSRLEQLPGVERAAVTLTPPVDATGWFNSLTIEGRPVPLQDLPPVSYVVASAGYLELLRVPLLSGRLYERGEPRGEHVAVINRTAAQRHWPGVDPIGQRILGVEDQMPWARVVGVVEDIRQSLSEPVHPEVFVPVAQDWVQSLVLMVRTDGDPLQAVPMVRRTIRELDRDVPMTRPMTLADRIGATTAQPASHAAIMTAFAATAVLLAAAGVFGVVSYSTAERRREFGIRLAVGARRGAVLRQVLGECARLAAVAVGIGLLLAVLVGALVRNLLFGVASVEPVVLAATAGVLAAMTLAAGFWPARAAAAGDPLAALRED